MIRVCDILMRLAIFASVVWVMFNVLMYMLGASNHLSVQQVIQIALWPPAVLLVLTVGLRWVLLGTGK
jgi:hypothetical protein